MEVSEAATNDLLPEITMIDVEPIIAAAPVVGGAVADGFRIQNGAATPIQDGAITPTPSRPATPMPTCPATSIENGDRETTSPIVLPANGTDETHDLPPDYGIGQQQLPPSEYFSFNHSSNYNRAPTTAAAAYCNYVSRIVHLTLYCMM